MDNIVASKITFVNSKLVNDIKAKVQINWLRDCIEYFLNDNQNISNNDLYDRVQEQFLLANLTETSHRVLTESFQTKKEAWTFKESILLQMQQILEISEPFYDQWRRLHDQKLDEVIEDNRETKTFHTKKNRMFKMELTDGYKTVYAMEMRQIACLNTKLTPGIKILFIGPVQVVNHIIMIKPENVKVIGGEVDELMIVNAYENVLLKLLKKPTTTKPILKYTEPTVENEKSTIAKPTNLIQMNENQKKQNSNIQQYKPKIDQQSLDDMDDFGIDLAMIEAIEAQERQKPQEPNNAALMIDDDEDDLLLAQIDFDNIEQQNISQQMELIHVSPEPTIPNENALTINETRKIEAAKKRKSVDSPENLQATKSIKLSEVRKPTIIDIDYPYKIDSKYNFITLDQYAGIKLRDKMEREYAIEASVSKVMKIKATDNGWLLIVQIKDSYSQNTLSVRFVDKIVSEFGGRTVKEILLLRQQIERGQPQLKMDIENTLGQISEALKRGPFLLTIQMVANLPAEYENVITQILQKTDRARQIIALKIEKENICLA